MCNKDLLHIYKKILKFFFITFLPYKEKNIECPICTDDFDETYDTVALPREHNYCKDCIHTWIKSRADCPLCRKNIITE